MKVTTQTLENRQIEMSIEVEDERVQQALQSAARRIAGQINIPGFRKGKAPYPVVVRAIGEETLYDEMLKELAPKLVQEALQEANLNPYHLTDMAALKLKPLSFKVTLSLPPVVDLGDYRSLRVPFEAPPVPEEAINNTLEDIRQRNTVIEPAGDGPAEWGQVAVLHIAATVGEGEPLDFTEYADESGGISVLLDEQKESFLPGFSVNVVGMKVGDEKPFSLLVPADFSDEGLRGKTVNFTVKLNDLKKLVVPPLDDALAQTIGNYESLDQLRTVLHNAMEQNLKAQAEATYVDACVEKLAESATIEFPPILIEEELDRIIEEVDQRLRSQKMNLDEMLNIKKQTKEQYREEMKPRAIKRVRQGLAIGKFIEMENLAPEEGKENEIIHKALDRLTAICKGESPAIEAAAGESAPAEAPAVTPPAASQDEPILESNDK